MMDSYHPMLGIATTRELIEELEARWEVAHVNNPRSYTLEQLRELFESDGSMDYRTVDS
jgi:hypothetical protein